MGIVDPHFLDTFGVRLLSGRFFDARDRAAVQPVVVIDGKMAAQMWPHGDALNRKLVLYPGKKWARDGDGDRRGRAIAARQHAGTIAARAC